MTLGIDADVEDDEENAGPATSLRGTIEALLNDDLNVRWTAQKVLAHLKSINYPLRAKEPIYSVGQTLNILFKKGKIRLVRRGTGSAPHIYKGKAPGQAPDATTEPPSETLDEA